LDRLFPNIGNEFRVIWSTSSLCVWWSGQQFLADRCRLGVGHRSLLFDQTQSHPIPPIRLWTQSYPIHKKKYKITPPPYPTIVAVQNEDYFHQKASRKKASRQKVSVFGDRGFAAAGPVLWNSLPPHLRDADLPYSRFRWSLKTFLFGYWGHVAMRTILTAPSINNLTYLLSYIEPSSVRSLQIWLNVKILHLTHKHTQHQATNSGLTDPDWLNFNMLHYRLLWPIRSDSTRSNPRLRLRSANRHQLIVPRCRLSNYGRRAFSIAGPTVWNSLPDELVDPARSFDSFRQILKTTLFSPY